MNVRQFLEPAGTSGVLQVLDQVFAALHQRYTEGITQLEKFHDHQQQQKLNRGEITQAQVEPFAATRYDCISVFADLHTPAVNWITVKGLVGAAHSCGLTMDGPCLEAIPKERLFDDEAGTAAALGGLSTGTEYSGTPQTEANARNAALLFSSQQNIDALPKFGPKILWKAPRNSCKCRLNIGNTEQSDWRLYTRHHRPLRRPARSSLLGSSIPPRLTMADVGQRPTKMGTRLASTPKCACVCVQSRKKWQQMQPRKTNLCASMNPAVVVPIINARVVPIRASVSP